MYNFQTQLAEPLMTQSNSVKFEHELLMTQSNSAPAHDPYWPRTPGSLSFQPFSSCPVLLIAREKIHSRVFQFLVIFLIKEIPPCWLLSTFDPCGRIPSHRFTREKIATIFVGFSEKDNIKYCDKLKYWRILIFFVFDILDLYI